MAAMRYPSRLRTGLLAGALLLTAAPAGAQPADAPEAAEPASPEAVPAEQLLSAADAAVDAGDLQRAQILYDRLLRDHPQAAEARDARRALKILVVRQREPLSAPPQANVPEGVVVRQEPYSLHTSERLRLTTWEKLDFGVTSFLYGLSVGFSYGISTIDESGGGGEGAATAAMALGAVTYTFGSIAYLTLAKPSRGDLPLALGIASYLPTTTLLVANLVSDQPDAQTVGLMTAGAGVVALPMAVLATHWLDLDPGDTQLVRDAGFWGLVLGTAGTLGFAGRTVQQQFGPGQSFESYQQPTGRTLAVGGLTGLYGGLALGALAASQTEVSLERVRVATWGGYGGALLGALLMSSADEERDVWRGLTVGGLLGLTLTFAATWKLDGIPPETPVISQAPVPFWRRLFPTVSVIDSADGRVRPSLGLVGPLP